jgi:ubiquinol-cytochrome c reductase iron-sulfur subunit
MAGNDRIDRRRRRFLVKATSVIGGAGLVTASLPFIFLMLPSARSRASGAPVEVDISKLEETQMLTVSWRQRPVMILRRSLRQLETLPTLAAQLKDPDSDAPQQLPLCRNDQRLIKPEYLVAVAICTHLGCVPIYRPEIAPADLGSRWEGGFLLCLPRFTLRPCRPGDGRVAGAVESPRAALLLRQRHRVAYR